MKLTVAFGNFFKVPNRGKLFPVHAIRACNTVHKNVRIGHDFLSVPRKYVAWYIRRERSGGKRRQEGVDACIPKRRNFTRKVSLYLCNSCLP